MTAEALQGLVQAANAVGLLGLVILAVWAFYTGRVVTKSAAAAQKEAYQQSVAMADERRQEERDARLAAETRLASMTASIENLAAVIREVKDELIRRPRESRG